MTKQAYDIMVKMLKELKEFEDKAKNHFVCIVDIVHFEKPTRDQIKSAYRVAGYSESAAVMETSKLIYIEKSFKSKN